MSSLGEPTSASALPPKPKRQLFNRPAWAATRDEPAKKTEGHDDVFSRSAESYKEILAEKERKKQAKGQKKADKEARRDSGRGSEKKKRTSEGGSGSIDSKKRIRITDDDYAAFGVERTPKKEELRERDDTESPIKKQPATTKPAKKQMAVIELGDSDDEDELGSQTVVDRRAPVPAPAPAYEEDSEEEFPELVAAARERRRQRELDTLNRSITPNTSNNPTSTRQAHEPTPPPAPDPVIQVLITSDIPDTRPLVVHRKLSQRLQEIRLVWCEKQGFSKEMTANVFLIYKLRKLYDVTTCKSLGIECDSEGRIMGRGNSVFESEEDKSRVHVLAVTEQMFEQMKRDREAGFQRSMSAPDPKDAHEGSRGETEDVAATQSDSLIRVLLKAKGYKDFKLKVKQVSDGHLVLLLVCC